MEGLQTQVTCDRAHLRRVHECDEQATNEVVVLEQLGACLQAVAIDRATGKTWAMYPWVPVLWAWVLPTLTCT